MYGNDLNERNYRFSISKNEDVGIKYLNDPKSFIEHSNAMDDVYNNIVDYNSTRKRKILIVFHDRIADIMTHKTFQVIKVTTKTIYVYFIKQKLFGYSPSSVLLN